MCDRCDRYVVDGLVRALDQSISRLVAAVERNGSLRYDNAELKRENKKVEDQMQELQMELAGYRMANATGEPPEGDKPKPATRSRK